MDPSLALAWHCDKAEIAISDLPKWTGRRLCKWLNMTYNGSHVAWGKANREHRVDVDFSRLIQMCRFDCENTLCRFCSKINRRKFGVPMGAICLLDWLYSAVTLLCDGGAGHGTWTRGIDWNCG